MSSRTWLSVACLLVMGSTAAVAQEAPGTPAQESEPAAPAASTAEPGGPSGEPSSAEASPAAEGPAEEGPWRLADHLPEWLHVEGTHRARYAYVTNALRRGVRGDNRAISLRTTILLELRGDPFEVPLRAGVEILDGRLYADDSNLALSTGMVNAVEPLQAYLRFDLGSVLPGEGFLRAGRLTADFGSRRLVARNRFRNTINAFTGLEIDHEHTSGWRFHGLFGSPIQRRPSDRDDLDDNKISTDREHEQVLFWGALVASPELGPLKVKGEAYLFGLHEEDVSDRATRDRELYTPGLRVYRKAERAEFDFELEAVYQFGSSRSSNAGRLLDHNAYFVHLALGYTFDHGFKPRLILQYDYASGDRNPNDGDNTRFDTLFGARRFEFGATGIFGPIARSNVSSPGVRFQVHPRSDLRIDLVYRAFWLADERDAWTASGVQDPAGSSSAFVGHLLETRARWEIYPKNVRLEAGVAALVRGSFARRAPGANAGEHLMSYAHVVFSF